MTDLYAAPPPGAPPMHGPDDEEQLWNAAHQRAKDVADKAYWIRINEEARATVQADKATDTNFAEQYLTRADLINLPSPEPLIDKVLPRHAYAILRGRDQSFKSFVAIDWALCLATGKPWQQHDVDPVRVLYIAGEGAQGLRSRIDAWEFGWGRNVPPDMLTVRQTALNLHQPGPAFDHLLEHVHHGSYGLVVIDTLRRVSGAADGNSSEMGAVIDNIDRIKHATDRGTVLTVAHTDKGDNDTRGYSGIEDDADVVWAAKREDDLLTLSLTKFKDGRDGTQMGLIAQPTLGSLVLAGTTGTPTVNTTESQLKILDTIRDLFPDGVRGPELMKTTTLARATFYRALKDLQAAGQLTNTGTKKQPYYELPGLVDTTPEHAQDAPDDSTLEETA